MKFVNRRRGGSAKLSPFKSLLHIIEKVAEGCFRFNNTFKYS